MNDLKDKLKVRLNEFTGVKASEVESNTAAIIDSASSNASEEVYKTILGCLDLTALNTTDTVESIQELVYKVNTFKNQHPTLPNVAAICVYPSFVAAVRECISAPGVEIASVAGGFPSAQTFIEVKVAETSLAVMDGADEIDIVLGVGEFLAGNIDKVFEDISEVKAACGEAKLKVILETSALDTAENIYNASIIAMEAGADFIKTSTGKEGTASPKAAYVMTQAIQDFFQKTGQEIGFKAAGGIATTDVALQYYSIVKENLGEGWLSHKLFRIGASRLANDLLKQLGDESYF